MAENCIFCSIAGREIPSNIIEDASDSVSVLEINPISRGHALVIPKKHGSLNEKIPENISKAVQEISKDIMHKFSPKDIIVAKASLFGHDVVNIIPVYKDENVSSKRHQAKKEELDEVQMMLNKKAEQKEANREPKMVVKKPKVKKISSKKTWLPKRIP